MWNDNFNRWLLVVNTTWKGRKMPKLKYPCLLFWEHSKPTTLLKLGDFHFGPPHSPSKRTYRWIKDGNQEDWQESWLPWQQADETPQLMKLIVRHQVDSMERHLAYWLLSFMHNSVHGLRLIFQPVQGAGGDAALEWQGDQGGKNQQRALTVENKGYQQSQFSFCESSKCHCTYGFSKNISQLV